MTDHELLQQYVTSHSDDAFRELMNRHAGLVFSAALRQVGDIHLAEEIAQTVFVLLARKAASLQSETVLPAWLWQTARFTALRAIRSANRREHYENEAASVKSADRNSEENWIQVSPLINEAIGRLSEMDRNAILLRFYETKSFGDIAITLKITEAAAQKRVARSLEKVRRFFSKKGYAITSVSLGALLSSQTSEAMPESIRAVLPLRVMARLGSGGTANGLENLAWRDVKLAKIRRTIVPAGAAVAVILLFFSLAQRFTTVLRERPSQMQELVDSSAKVKNVAIGTESSKPISHSVVFHVVDVTTKQPLPAVALISFDMFDPSIERATDLNGTFSVDLPEGRFPGMLISLASDGYRHRLRNYKPTEGNQLESDQIIEMYTSSTLTGKVQDETGQPVAGAQLVLDDFRLELGLRRGMRYRSSLATAISDSEGRWTLRQLPKESEEIWLHVVHPDYKPTKVSFSLTKPNENVVIVLKQGIRVTGQVINENGEPVQASLSQPGVQGLIPYNMDTESDGTFVIEHAAPESFRLRVAAPGYAAQLVSVEPKKESNLELKLQKSAILHGRVVDESGNPVAAANVATASDQFGNDEWLWNTKTDRSGRFIWDSAPIGSHLYGVLAPGYALRSGIPLDAEKGEQILKLNKTKIRIFEGAVVDSSSGAAIPEFEVIMSPGENLLAKGTNGHFKIEYEDHGLEESFVLSIRANDYSESFAEPRRFAQSARKFVFRMERSISLEGTVLDPDGEPAIGAVLTLTKSQPLPIASRPEGMIQEQMTVQVQERTDARGQFRFSDGQTATGLFVSHPRGCARIEGAPWPKVIKLQEWGKIEGFLKIGLAPAAGKPLLLSGELFPFSYRTNSDETGHFVFEQVPPGPVLLYRYINPHPDEPGPVGLSHETRLEILPGETTQVELGSEGRRLIGRLITDRASEKLDWTHDCYYLEPISNRPNIPAKASPTLRYYFICSADGTFQVEDIPPGMYRLVVRVTTESYGSSTGLQILASTEREIKVDASESDKTENPIDIGEISVPVSPSTPIRGQQAAKRI